MTLVLTKDATHCIGFKVAGGFGGAPVWLRMEERLDLAEAPTIAEGEVEPNESYEICGISPGDYRVHLSSIIASRPAKLANYAMSIVTVANRDRDLGTIEPLPTADISGKVVLKIAGTESAFPAGLRPLVQLVPREVTSIAASLTMTGFYISPDDLPGQTKQDGTFTLPRVFQGDYGIRLNGLPSGYYIVDAVQQGRSVLENGLRPGAGDLRVALADDGAVISGNVVGPNRATVPYACVFILRNETSQHLFIQADQYGAFQIGVPPGNYRIAAVREVSLTQRQDPTFAQPLVVMGSPLKLGSREHRSVDLDVLRLP
ncbi:MAG: carboxypeptidase-like regulatory domain-containing protein [Acidobacteriota bacterium]